MGTPDVEGDPLRALGGLPRVDLDPRRAREIRDRAVALLETRGRRTERRLALVEAGFAQFVQPVLAGGLSLGFAAWVLSRSIEVLAQVRGGFFWP